MVETTVSGKVTENILKERSGTMPNMQTVRLVHDMIKDQFGSLDDLPREISIPIASLYYKFTANLLEVMGFPPERKVLIPEMVKRQIKQYGSMVGKFLSEDPYILAELKSVFEKVKASRQQAKETKGALTDSNVELILKNLKSNGITETMAGTQQPR